MIGNSLKFSKFGDEINIKLNTIEKKNNVLISVEDNGIGMKDNEQR